MAAKRSKESVGYSRGMKTAHCSNCRFYMRGGSCRKVRGKIDPGMWCRLFARKRG